MRFDLQTSLGILCAVTSLTCVGYKPNNGSRGAVQEVSKENVAQSNTNKLSVILTPSNQVSRTQKTGTSHSAHISHASHSSHGAHMSHSSHASSRF